jgi:hypothetical protein
MRNPLTTVTDRAMTMTLPASTPEPANSASLDQVLPIVVALIGTIECLGGLSNWSMLFGDMSKIRAIRRAG